MGYKLLVLDIDGTIVPAHEDIPSQSVIAAIREASRRSVIVLASGRAWQDQKKIVDLLGLNDNYHVIENGARVVFQGGKFIHEALLSKDDVRRILGTADGLFHDGALSIEGKWTKLTEAGTASTVSLISATRTQGLEIQKRIMLLPESYTVTVGAHWDNLDWAVILINHRDASKGKGLSHVQRLLHISSAETIIVGDGATDMSMVPYAGFKVAMANAEKELLGIADYVAPDVRDDGLVEVIEKFILQ